MDQPWRYRLEEFDRKIFQSLVPEDHPLMDSLRLIPWDIFVPQLEQYYHPDRGQPAMAPLLILKLELLRYMYNLSDRQVMERADTDILFRCFLQVPIRFQLPDASVLCKFRGRLGTEGFKAIFDQLVAFGRTAGLVKDRLRLKDASHVVANIAVPSTIKLLGQLRDKLLDCLQPFDAESAEGFRMAMASIREQTSGKDATTRLEARVEHMKDIVHFTDQLATPPDATVNCGWLQLQRHLQTARKILDDQAHPEQGRRTVSIVDTEARRGKHGDWYDGYSLDVMMDAESELITHLNLMEAGGDEAQSAVAMVRGEQATHGNKIDELSIDGAGFNGKMLRELEDPDGLNVTVFVPPKDKPESKVFPSSEFKLSDDGQSVVCPAGETSSYRQQGARKNGTIFRFKRSQCDGCPLVAQCMPKPGSGLFGRSVTKNDYETEYDRARARATTDAYQEVRRRHPAIERKLNELMNHHDGRHARYWGRAKVAAQQYMTAFTVNFKRTIQLLTRATTPVPA